jgi:very-short-patch-repair endonuclease
MMQSTPRIAASAARQLMRSELEIAKSDRRKDAALTWAGYRVMRFTYDDVVYEPDTVVARLTPRSAAA